MTALRENGVACVTRALDLLFEMANHHFGMTYSDMCESLGCSKRTVHRYLAALSGAGAAFRIETIPHLLPGRPRIKRIRLVAIRNFQLRPILRAQA